jgi:hypothetical protein
MELHRYVETEYSPKNGSIASLLTKKSHILFEFSPRQRSGILNLMIRSVIQVEGSYDRYPAPPQTSSSQTAMLFYLPIPSTLSVP